MSAARSLVVPRAQAAFGDRLLGVLAMGSWARGDAAASSDLDVLVVIDPTVPLTRDLYRAWDREPLVFEGRPVDAHFAHPPQPGASPTAVWCEAAVDGLVWYDRDGRILRRLGEVRRAIADRRVVKGSAHGQPYWKGAA
jgi:predicted nucleotidyltransferase